jgi:hypothetical protein
MNRTAKNILSLLTPVLAGSAVVLAATLPAGAKPASTTTSAKVKRGEYLVKTSGCHDCHTPLKMGERGPEPDMTRMLSGHPAALVMPPAPKLPPGPWIGVMGATSTAWNGPWGTSFTANLTPHKQTGTGQWTERNFVDTIRSGRHLGRGRAILPPMPWPMYRNFTDADLGAIFAYLQSIPAIDNKVPEPIIAPPPAEVAAHR